MSIQIQLECEQGVLGCVFSLILFLICGITLIFSIYGTIQIYRVNQAMRFEQFPLICSLCQSLTFLIINVFIINFYLLLFGDFIQSITYLLVAFSFCNLYYRLNDQNNFIKKKKILIAFMIILIGFDITGLILSIIDISIIDCKNWDRIDFYVPYSVDFISIVICVYYGYHLVNKIEKQQKIASQTLSQNFFDNYQSNSDTEIKQYLISEDQQFYQNQINVIQFVIVTFSITWILQMIEMITRASLFDNDIICVKSFSILISDIYEIIFMFIYSLIQIVPSVIVPYAFYYIPYMRTLQTIKKIKFSDQQIQKYNNKATQKIAQIQDKHNSSIQQTSFESSNSDYRIINQSKIQRSRLQKQQQENNSSSFLNKTINNNNNTGDTFQKNNQNDSFLFDNVQDLKIEELLQEDSNNDNSNINNSNSSKKM